jgi:voltage-gated sodium channel
MIGNSFSKLRKDHRLRWRRSFILLGTMIMLNLFIGVIMKSMEEMHSELNEYNAVKRVDTDKDRVLDKLAALDQQVASLKSNLAELCARLTIDAQ